MGMAIAPCCISQCSPLATNPLIIVISEKGVCMCKMHSGTMLCILAWWFIVLDVLSLFLKAALSFFQLILNLLWPRRRRKRKRLSTNTRIEPQNQVVCYIFWGGDMAALFCSSVVFWCLLIFFFVTPPVISNATDLCNCFFVLFFFLSLLNSSIFHFSLFCCFYNNRRVIFQSLRFTLNPVHATLGSYFLAAFSCCALYIAWLHPLVLKIYLNLNVFFSVSSVCPLCIIRCTVIRAKDFSHLATCFCDAK